MLVLIAHHSPACLARTVRHTHTRVRHTSRADMNIAPLQITATHTTTTATPCHARCHSVKCRNYTFHMPTIRFSSIDCRIEHHEDMHSHNRHTHTHTHTRNCAPACTRRQVRFQGLEFASHSGTPQLGCSATQSDICLFSLLITPILLSRIRRGSPSHHPSAPSTNTGTGRAKCR